MPESESRPSARWRSSNRTRAGGGYAHRAERRSAIAVDRWICVVCVPEGFSRITASLSLCYLYRLIRIISLGLCCCCYTSDDNDVPVISKMILCFLVRCGVHGTRTLDQLYLLLLARFLPSVFRFCLDLCLLSRCPSMSLSGLLLDPRAKFF